MFSPQESPNPLVHLLEPGHPCAPLPQLPFLCLNPSSHLSTLHSNDPHLFHLNRLLATLHPQDHFYPSKLAHSSRHPLHTSILSLLPSSFLLQDYRPSYL